MRRAWQRSTIDAVFMNGRDNGPAMLVWTAPDGIDVPG
jgi:hypothetical protein